MILLAIVMLNAGLALLSLLSLLLLVRSLDQTSGFGGLLGGSHHQES